MCRCRSGSLTSEPNRYSVAMMIAPGCLRACSMETDALESHRAQPLAVAIAITIPSYVLQLEADARAAELVHLWQACDAATEQHV